MALIWTNGWTMTSFFNFAFVLGLHSIAARSVSSPAQPLTPIRAGAAAGRAPCPDTTQAPLLASVRLSLMSHNLYGYIFLDQDPHKDENTHASDRHASIVSGYHSMYGNVAIVTLTSQAVFVQNRTAAETVVDCSWHVDDFTGLDFTQWTVNNSPFGVRIGADGRVVDAQLWAKLDTKFNISGITLVDLASILPLETVQNGNEERGINATNEDAIYVQGIEYAGKSWVDKMTDLLQGMTLDESDALVATTVDDIAWLFNLRGRYYEFSPLFPAFAIIVPEFQDIGRHLQIILYLKNTELSRAVRHHLKLDDCKICVQIKHYDKIYDDLLQIDKDTTMKNIIMDRGARFGILNKINPYKMNVVHTPISLMKVVKNDVEIQNMRNACLRDAAYVAKLAAGIEQTVSNDGYINELQASELLDTYRQMDELNRGNAFTTVSAYGPNAAVVHYMVSNASSVQIRNDNLYVLDSGGQYLDGTVDGTRTFHFGEPKPEHKELYTRVLMAVIDVFSLTWVARQGTPSYLTLLARRPLWDLGLDFDHGAGHGVGQFMNVHEEPVNFIRRPPGLRDGLQRYVFQPGVVQAIEPGAYVNGKFGVRLETMGVVKLVENDAPRDQPPTPSFVHQPRLQFVPLYFLPFESKLIQYDLLTNRQIYWLNSYHSDCRRILGEELRRMGYSDAYEWLKSRTEIVSYNSGISSHLRDSGAVMFRSRFIHLMTAVVIVVVMFIGV